MGVTNIKNGKKKDVDKRRGWGKVPTIANYMDMSSRSLRYLINSGEIPYSRLSSGTILIRFDSVDEYLAKKEIKESQMDHVISEIFKNIKK